jgi:hypothetical protein
VAGPTTGQKWSDPADASPICSSALEKAKQFQMGFAAAIPQLFMLQKKEEAPSPSVQF